MRKKLIELAQGYLGMTPADKGCSNWNEMQHKMADEMLAIIQGSEDAEAQKIILKFPRETKLGMLKDALKENKFGIFLGLAQVLLDAPIDEGGIETEAIEKIRQEYLKPKA